MRRLLLLSLVLLATPLAAQDQDLRVANPEDLVRAARDAPYPRRARALRELARRGHAQGAAVVSAAITAPRVELRLEGADLLSDPSLRQGLVNLWTAEADQAGLQIRTIEPLGTGVRNGSDAFALAEMRAAGQQWVLTAMPDGAAPGMICVKANPV